MAMNDPAATEQEKTVSGLTIGEGARFLVTAAAAVIVIFGLQQARDLLVPIMLAGFLAIISYSITGMLRKYLRFPHWLAVLTTVLVDGGIMFGIIRLVNFLAQDFKKALQGDFADRIVTLYNNSMATLNDMGLSEQARELARSPQEILEMVGSARIIAFTQGITSSIVSFMSTTTLVLILMTFLLSEAPLFHSNLRRLPNSTKGKTELVNALMGIQRYLLIKTISSIATGILAWILCSVMGVPFAFLWAVLAFLLNYIPTIGSIVAAIPPIILALLMGGWGDSLIVMAGYLLINCGIGNGIEPLFLGKQFGIATSLVLLSVLLWGWVFGPCGMFLAVPITVLMKLALENSQDLAWVATIIGDGKSSKQQ